MKQQNRAGRIIGRKKTAGWLPVWFLGLVLLAGANLRADELVTTSGERLVGRVVSETAEYVEFHSDAFGPIRVSRSAIARVERSGEQAPAAPGSAAPAPGRVDPAVAENQAAATPAEDQAGTPAPAEAAAEDASRMDTTIRRFYPLKGWKTSFRFGLLARRGTDSDTSIDLGYRSEKIDTRNREYLFEIRYYRKDNVHLDNTRTTSDDNITGEFRFRSHFRPRWFYQTNTRYYRDPMVNLLNEATQTAGVGYWLLDGKQARLSVGPAAGAQYTEYTTESGWHFVAGLYQDLQWKLWESFRIRESIYYIQDPWNKDQQAVRLSMEVTQSLSRVLSLSFSWDYAFEGEVGGNITQNQQRMGLTLGINF